MDEHESLARDHYVSPDVADVVQVANLIENVKELPEAALPDFAEVTACRRLHIDHESIRRILDDFALETASMEQAPGV